MRNDNRITKKLRSEKGASITFGLLLFLICAVISSMVIVAGTSAAGRLSGMSKTEQRYYSVTSTAKLIQEKLEKGSVSVVEYDDETYIGTGNELKKVKKKDGTINATYIKSLPVYVVYNLESGNKDFEFTLTPTDQDAVTVKAKEEDDVIGFAISSEASGGYSFLLKMTTNKKTVPIEMNVGEGGSTASVDKTEYTWEVPGESDYTN